MKSLPSLTILSILIFSVRISYSQSNIKTWTETTARDFSDDSLNNLIVTNNNGGQVQLLHPLQKTVDDHIDNSVLHFVAKDSAGNYVKTWIARGDVIVKKYRSDGSEVTQSIKANEGSPNCSDSHVAMLSDGTYIVVWIGPMPTGNKANIWGMMFKNDSIRVGHNFLIVDSTEYSQYGFVPVADNTNRFFWIIYISDSLNLSADKIDSAGNKIGATIRLNNNTGQPYECSPNAVCDKTGFWVTWGGGPDGITWDLDVYLRRYNFDGSPACNIIMVNDNTRKMQCYADLCLDDKSNLFVAWIDERDADNTNLGLQYNIYGQIFKSDGTKLGNNIKLNSVNENKSNGQPYIEFFNNQFQVSWDSDISAYYINRWKLDPKLSGELISSIYDTGPGGSVLDTINWDWTPHSLTNIKFQIKSAKAEAQLNSVDWYGPSSTTDFYTKNTGEKINSHHSGDRYIQYKSIFISTDGNTSILKSVSIKYRVADTVPPLPPSMLTATPSHSKMILNWRSNSETDLREYIVHRGTASGRYDSSWGKSIPPGITTFEDLTAKTGIKYYYVLTAVDSTHNESNFSKEASATPFGINIYVNAGVSVSGNGSIDNPYKKIQEGIDAAIFGDTIRVLAGLYTDPLTMKNGVSLIGESTEKCKIVTPIFVSDSCIIKGFTIMRLLTCNNGSPLITENIFVVNTASYDAAIRVASFSSPTITKNFISECRFGISVDYQCNPLIKNNIVQAQDDGIIMLGTPTLINNTVIAQKKAAIDLFSFVIYTVTIKNNILVGGIYTANSNPPNSKINYNDIWNPYDASYQLLSTNLNIDPRFVNKDLQDYHLSSLSQCINSGDPNSAYNDIDGSRNDIGAYGGPDPIPAGLSSKLVKSILVSNLSGYPGDTVSVFISLDNAAGMAQAGFSLEYDETVLKYIRSILTKATENFTLQTQTISSNKINISLSSLSPMPAGAADILEVQFIVNLDSKTEDSSPLLLKNVSLVDAGSREIIIRSVTDGVFIVNFISESKNCIFVDSKYRGTGNGTRQQPFNTIKDAINKSADGDSIIVLGGNYYESDTVKNGIHIIGSGAMVTNLIVKDQIGFIFKNILNAEITGFTIKNDRGRDITIPLIYCDASSPTFKKNRIETDWVHDIGIQLYFNSNATFENNLIRGLGFDIYQSNPTIVSNTMEMSDSSLSPGAIFCRINSAPIIQNNIISGCLAGPSIFISYSSATIKNNILYGTGAGGVDCIYLAGATNVKVYNNIMKDLNPDGGGISILNSAGCEIINNTIVTNGIGIREDNSTSTIYNNIITGNSYYGVQFSSTVFDYNDVWNNHENYEYTTPAPHDISSDPLFINAAKEDFRLSAGSPCINAGNPDPKYNDVNGSRNDIGAYGGLYVDSTWMYEGSSLAMDSINAFSNDTIKVTINGDGIKGIAEIDLMLSFDPTLLTPIDAQNTSMTKSFSLEKGKMIPGIVNLSSKSNNGISIDKGNLIELRLAVNSKKALNTVLHFDSAAVKDEAACTRRIIKLKDGQISIKTGVGKDGTNQIPKTYTLFQNYPNPFNPMTTIRYEIPKNSKVTLIIYDLLGREIATLFNGNQKAGRFELEWNAKSFSSGIYFYSLRAGSFYQTKKMVLIK